DLEEIELLPGAVGSVRRKCGRRRLVADRDRLGERHRGGERKCDRECGRYEVRRLRESDHGTHPECVMVDELPARACCAPEPEPARLIRYGVRTTPKLWGRRTL